MYALVATTTKHKTSYSLIRTFLFHAFITT